MKLCYTFLTALEKVSSSVIDYRFFFLVSMKGPLCTVNEQSENNKLYSIFKKNNK